MNLLYIYEKATTFLQGMDFLADRIGKLNKIQSSDNWLIHFEGAREPCGTPPTILLPLATDSSRTIDAMQR